MLGFIKISPKVFPRGLRHSVPRPVLKTLLL